MASISHNITFVGTLQSNKRDIPIQVKNVAEREWFSCQCLWESSENIPVLHSYVLPTKSSGQCNVFHFSTVELILGVTIDNGKKKPLYDFTKAGTYVMEHRIGAYCIHVYTCKAKSNPWTLTALFYILNVHRINAGTAFVFNKKIDICKQDLYDFGINFAFSFIRPPIQRRP